jgi:putative glutamine amidotransferase
MTYPHPRPVVLVSCSYEDFDVQGFGTLKHQAVFERYVDAIVSAFDCTPLLLPALGDAERAREYAELADGAVLTGAASNIAPVLYGGLYPEDAAKLDPRRDGTTLPFVRAAIAAGVPVLGLCRGLQEMNVALGGTLHQRVHEMPTRADHRAPRDRPVAERYLPAHSLRVRENSWLESILVARGIDVRTLSVNSLHGQAIDALGRGVVVEATAEDGTVEAIRVADAPAFAFGVQWHAEWYVEQTPLHAAIFEEFGRACRDRRALRSRGSAAVPKVS